MVDWQVTATTVRCDVTDDDVTLLVYQDWSLKCTGHAKYSGNSGKTGRNKGGSIRRCEGTNCQVASRYLQKLKAEEAKG